jgi:hypothetical protein
VNHFQGRVSCPYGQQADGTPVPGTVSCTSSGNNGCCTPATDLPVTGQDGGAAQATVLPQCIGRTSSDAVYCSCRCANVIGGTNDGANYCTCPSGFTCTLLSGPFGPVNPSADSFCIKDGTQYDAGSLTCNSTCDPSVKNCGNVQGVRL